MNQRETDLVRQGLRRIGYHGDGREGDSKSRHVIRKLARDNPLARIVVMAC